MAYLFLLRYSNIDFDTIDIDFYNEYVKYLMHDLKFRYSTIGDNIKRLKTILNEATERYELKFSSLNLQSLLRQFEMHPLKAV